MYIFVAHISERNRRGRIGGVSYSDWYSNWRI